MIYGRAKRTNNLIPTMIEQLEEKNKISMDNGAYVSNFESDPKILITKSDGSYLYLTTDLATVLWRQKKISLIKQFMLLINDRN